MGSIKSDFIDFLKLFAQPHAALKLLQEGKATPSVASPWPLAFQQICTSYPKLASILSFPVNPIFSQSGLMHFT